MPDGASNLHAHGARGAWNNGAPDGACEERVNGESEGVRFADIAWRGEPVRIEYRWTGADDPGRPTLVFLHEGLGSVSMWRDFPDRVCAAARARGLVYSRPGYGASTLPAAERARDPDYLHRQAYEVLPAFLEAAGVAKAAWLFGHSDGGSIALLHAARFPERVAGVIAMAPHLFVEDVTVEGVRRARDAAEASGTLARLARHHGDPQWVFDSWTAIWLDPRFRAWNIEREVGAIRGPVLAIQGLDDEYGTLEQIRALARHLPRVTLLEISGAGHAPQRDRPQPVIDAVSRFLASGGS